MDDCELCRYLYIEPRCASGTVGLNTSIAPLVAAAVGRLDAGGAGDAHVFLPVCPEHVVDIYRGRVNGVNMAWRSAPPV